MKQEIPNHYLVHYLNERGLAVRSLRSFILSILLFLINPLITLMIFVEPYNPLDLYLLLPLILALHLLGICIAITPYKWQVEANLFTGLLGLTASLGSILMAQKFAYGLIGIESPLFFILTAAGYLIVCITTFFSHIQKLKSGVFFLKNQSKERPRFSRSGAAWTTSFAFAGVLAANLILTFATDYTLVLSLVITVYLLTAVTMQYLMIYFYRYWLSRKHSHLLKKIQRPTRKGA